MNRSPKLPLACLTLPAVLALLGGCTELRPQPKQSAQSHPRVVAIAPATVARVDHPPEAQTPSAISALQSVFKPEPLSMAWIGDTLRQIAVESQAKANADQQRLQALGAQRTPADKLKLAYLLMARAAPTPEEATQAHDLLRNLDNQTEDPASVQFIRVMQRLSQQTVELAQSRAELTRANKEIADLQDKIGQIKNLEVELQDRTQSKPKNVK